MCKIDRLEWYDTAVTFCPSRILESRIIFILYQAKFQVMLYISAISLSYLLYNSNCFARIGCDLNRTVAQQLHGDCCCLTLVGNRAGAKPTKLLLTMHKYNNMRLYDYMIIWLHDWVFCIYELEYKVKVRWRWWVLVNTNRSVRSMSKQLV